MSTSREMEFTLNLVVTNALAALEFYEKVFEGERGEIYEFTNRQQENEANIKLGNVKLRLLDANPIYECYPPKAGEASPMWMQLMVADVDKTLKLAEFYGATDVQAPSESMGLRHAQFTDPFGYIWTINCVLKEISFQERYKAYLTLQAEQASDDEEKDFKDAANFRQQTP